MNKYYRCCALRIGSLQLSRSCCAAKDAFADLAHAKVGQPTGAFGSGRLAQMIKDCHISASFFFSLEVLNLKDVNFMFSSRLAKQRVFGCGFHSLGFCGSSCGCPTTFVHKARSTFLIWLLSTPNRMQRTKFSALAKVYCVFLDILCVRAVRTWWRWEYLEVTFPTCSEEPCNGTMSTRPADVGDHRNVAFVPLRLALKMGKVFLSTNMISRGLDFFPSKAAHKWNLAPGDHDGIAVHGSPGRCFTQAWSQMQDMHLHC